MKSILHFIVAVAISGYTLSSCERSSKPASAGLDMENSIIGTFHYETMNRTILDAGTDTLRHSFTDTPDGYQYYDVYRPDSVLEFYAIRNDSLMFTREYHYILRNDTIFAENDEKRLSVHIVNATDSTLCFNYTREQNDTTYYFQTTSRRAELPDWLKKQIKQP